MYNDEYNDLHYLKKLIHQHTINEGNKLMKERTNSLLLTEKFNAKLYNTTRKSIDITNFSIMKDDIKNYRTLTDIQLSQLETLTETEKIEIIKLYNIMFASIENLIN
jgi:hypothetical protein